MPGLTEDKIEVKFVEKLKLRLVDKSKTVSCKGCIYGIEIDHVKYVVAANAFENEKEIELVTEMLPCGLEPLGVFSLKGEGLEGFEPLVAQLPPLTHNTEVPLLVNINGDEISCSLGLQGAVINVGEITEEELWKKLTLIRVKANLVLNSGFSDVEMGAAFRHLIEKVSCPYGSFVMEGEQLIFLHKFLTKEPVRGWTKGDESADKEEEDCLIVGLEEDSSSLNVEDLWQFTQQEEEDDWGGKSNQKKKVQPKDRLEFKLVWNYSNPACSSRTIGCAPIIHREEKEGSTLKLPLRIDTLGLVHSGVPARQLMEVLKGSVARQLGDMAAQVINEFKEKKTVSTPVPFHFRPAVLGHHINLVYSKSCSTADLEPRRKSLHSKFLLPLDRPLFRRANKLSWDTAGQLRLPNVHKGLETKHGVGAGARVALVQGNYDYHHYMQDSFNDDGWGCAYRSLQTLVSWLKKQGFTESEVPGHKEIQKILVDIGDKESKFIGSKQWIGSTEVGFVLETLCGIESRFVSVSQGSDLVTKARELLMHFESSGSPVMIGGGVYAHTILGVAWDEATGDCSWLILDPHYTGGEDIKTILGKGWCGWKGPNFWNQTAFYNMCLPQPSKNTI